jgi:hypothetical protein
MSAARRALSLLTIAANFAGPLSATAAAPSLARRFVVMVDIISQSRGTSPAAAFFRRA